MKTNKQVKRMIARATGGEWINSRLINKPELLFFSDLIHHTVILHNRYHSTVSIKSNEVK